MKEREKEALCQQIRQPAAAAAAAAADAEREFSTTRAVTGESSRWLDWSTLVPWGYIPVCLCVCLCVCVSVCVCVTFTGASDIIEHREPKMKKHRPWQNWKKYIKLGKKKLLGKASRKRNEEWVIRLVCWLVLFFDCFFLSKRTEKKSSGRWPLVGIG